MLRALGYDQLQRYHMNEGHASLLTLALLDEHGQHAGRTTFTEDDIEAVREQCVFTTHTPVPAGHDQFAMDLVTRVLGRAEIEAMQEVFCCDGSLNMTYLAISLSHYVDGVAKKHGEVSRHMFAQYRIDAITNGVHAATWAAPSFQKLVDQYIPDWRADNFSLRYALSIPLQEVWDSHVQAKRQMIEYINHETNSRMDTNVLTLGFARRAATYKRADLLFHDIERLKAIALKTGKFQVV
jgi:starch phosphorylase